jgi:hypothetical protein
MVCTHLMTETLLTIDRAIQTQLVEEPLERPLGAHLSSELT